MSGEAAAGPTDGIRTPGPDQHFPVLDSLRAVGAIAVVVTHVAFWAGAYTQHGPIGPLLARLDVGVAIFFVLSGFLLSRPWLTSAWHGQSAPSVPRYFWKRILRIFPVYLVTTVIALALLTDNRDMGPAGWAVTLGMADIYVHARLPAGMTQMWSLATELAFYAVLPALMFIALGRRRKLHPLRLTGLLLIMVVITVLWLGFISTRIPGADGLPVNQWLPAFLSWFAVGIGLAYVHMLHAGGRLAPLSRLLIDSLAGAPGVCWALAFALLLVASTGLAGPTLLLAPTGAESLTKNLLYAGVGGLLVFTGVFGKDGAYNRAMSHRVPRRLGHISYSLFCIHLPVLHFVMWFTGYELFQGHLPQILLLTLVLSIAASELLYRFVELPAMRLRDVGRGAPAITTAAAKATRTK